ncbi:hypothetical protein ACIBVL_16390 [Streptomyces sp. NPDC049687]|uniref:hypothetical protein n=1 Tax=Streptomyces sp. NPDC049687 TaxID=3365596 RepID=UPI003790FA47
MRKLHKAGLVAAMIGSLGLAGAGVASAHGSGGDEGSRQCIQQGDVNVGLLNLQHLNLGLGGLLGSPGIASEDNSRQQSCVTGDGSYSVQVRGDSEDGSGRKHG